MKQRRKRVPRRIGRGTRQGLAAVRPAGKEKPPHRTATASARFDSALPTELMREESAQSLNIDSILRSGTNQTRATTM
jgi:acetyl-CoA acetyltransferase